MGSPGTQNLAALSRITRATLDSVVSVQAEQDRAIQDAVLAALDYLRENEKTDYSVLTAAYRHATGDTNPVPIRIRIKQARPRSENRRGNSERFSRVVSEIQKALEPVT